MKSKVNSLKSKVKSKKNPGLYPDSGIRGKSRKKEGCLLFFAFRTNSL